MRAGLPVNGLPAAAWLAAGLLAAAGCVPERAGEMRQQQPAALAPQAVEATAPAPERGEALHTRDYGRIDRHAMRATRAAERSLDALAAYLSSAAADDAERARAIFRWIAHRIDYDAETFFSGRFRNLTSDPEAVLLRRRAVCDGYAELFVALARRSGLEAVKISGHAKGFGYRNGHTPAGPANHAWNAVRIGGRWYLLDATWGAGSLDAERQAFRRGFEPHFFLTPPERFIYRHLPEDARWQLLERPLTARAFAEQALPTPVFFRHGLALLSHAEATVHTRGEVAVRIAAPPQARLTAQLLRGRRKVGGVPVLVQRTGQAVEVRVRPPRAGEYTLRVLSKVDPEGNLYEGALEYRLVAAEGVGGGAGFPEVYRPFVEREAWLQAPRRGRLDAGSRQRFHLRVPGAERVVAAVGERLVSLPRTGEAFSGEVIVPRGALVIYARFPGEEAYAGLLRYEGH